MFSWGWQKTTCSWYQWYRNVVSSTLLLLILCTKINGQVFNVEYVMTVVTHSHPKDHIAYAEFNSLFGQGKTINKRHNIYILMHTHCRLHKALDSIAHSSFQEILFMSLRYSDVYKVLSESIIIENIFSTIYRNQFCVCR